VSKPYFINGEWVTGPGTHRVVNPWDLGEIDTISVADAAGVEAAVESASRAFSSVRSSPVFERAALLQRIAAGLGERRAEIVDLLVREAGKPVVYAEVEADRARFTFEQAAHAVMASAGETLEMDATPPGRGHFGLVRRFPVGVILAVTPFNFPLNLVAHKVAPCIATGNTMVLKPALRTPLVALLLAEVLEAAGTPPGQVNTIPFGHEHVPALLADPRVKMLSFTGSAAVGWKLKSQAVRLKVALELGGNAAVVVESDAAWQAAIPAIASGAFGSAGQSCISVQRILVNESIYEDFRDALVARIHSHAIAGDPADRATVVGPMITPDAAHKAMEWIRDAEAAGARLLTPLRLSDPALLHPVLIEGAPGRCAVVREEAFAPLAVIDRFATFDEAIARVNDSDFGLQAGVFTSDIHKALRAFHEIEAGGVLINQVPTFRVENMPYGGVKDSGFGREGVRFAMGEMTEPRSLVVNLN